MQLNKPRFPRVPARPSLEALETRRLLAGSVTGTVFEDPNGDGQLDLLESAIVGARVYADLNQNGVFDLDLNEPQALVTSDGTYTLINVPNGAVTIRAEKPAGWRFTVPATGSHTVNIQNGQVHAGYNFGIDSPPQAGAPNAQSVDEQAMALEIGSFNDDASTGPWQVSVNWGDGTAATTFSRTQIGVLPQQSHIFADSGSYGVIVSITDAFGSTGSATFQVNVANMPPRADFGNSGPVAEGEPVTVSFQNIVDAAGDAAAGFRYSYDMDGDGAYEVVDVTTPTRQHTFNDNGIRTVRGRIKDKDGGVSEYGTQVQVTNVPPALSMTGPATADAGGTYTLQLGATDVGGDSIISWNINWGDGQSQTVTPATPTVNHTYAAEGDYVITATATDEDGTYPIPGSVSLTAIVPPATITGVIRIDSNGNNKVDSTDAGAFNRTVFLDSNNDGAWSEGEPTTLTNANGQYAFTGLEAGTYVLRIVVPAGWRSTDGVTTDTLTVGAGEASTDNNFLITRFGQISGAVFFDANRNKRREPKEKGLAKWRIFIDRNNNGSLDKGELVSKTTKYGNFAFKGLKAGKYIIRAIPNTGYKVNAPRGSRFVIKLAAAGNVLNRNFSAIKG